VPLIEIKLGVGFYTYAEAGRLLKVDGSTLRRWVQGYSYVKKGTRATRNPLIPSSLPPVDNITLLSFVDLIELRIVRALMAAGLSLQEIRKARTLAFDHLHVDHPFASRKLFVSRGGARKSIFLQILDDADSSQVVELTPRRHLQIESGELVQDFLAEVDFDQQTSFAQRWWPLGRTVPVVLDPAIASGAPTVEGTGVRTEVLAGLARRTGPVDAANAYMVSVSSAEAAMQFERILAAA